MKFDAMSLAAAIFVLGVLLSSISLDEVFASEPNQPQALQQGVALR